MRAAILSLVLLAGLSAASASLAQDAGTPDAHAQDKPPCDVPAYMLNSDSSLAKVAAAVKSGNPLNVLVVGSRSSTIGSQDASAAYPARLQATLKDKLGSVPVNLSVEIQSGKTAEEVAATLVKLVEAKSPTLVIWQTGTYDAIRGIDPDDFRSAVDEGVTALQKAGVDVVLVNLQYSPRTETMTSVPPYLDNMRVVAQQHDIPLFDRFAIMRHWNDSGDFDLFSATHGVELAKRVHACLGRALSKFVIDAAHLDQAQQN
jgi:lysophospholipase L1-like esterase